MKSDKDFANSNHRKLIIAKATTKRWLFLAVALFAARCDSGAFATTKVIDILSNPSSYVGESVTLKGDVKNTIKVPFFPGIYWLDDGTGEIPVVTEVPPLSSAKVRIRGRVDYLAAMGSVPVGLHVAESWRQ